jgi:hypothetical protein
LIILFFLDAVKCFLLLILKRYHKFFFSPYVGLFQSLSRANFFKESVMKSVIQIVHVVPFTGIGKKSGNPFDMRLAQCIVELVNPETGAPAPLIGELVLGEKFKDTLPGRYEVDFEIAVDRERRVNARVASMTPVAAGARVAAPGAAAAAAKA